MSIFNFIERISNQIKDKVYSDERDKKNLIRNTK